jgi:hypothetical protein
VIEDRKGREKDGEWGGREGQDGSDRRGGEDSKKRKKSHEKQTRETQQPLSRHAQTEAAAFPLSPPQCVEYNLRKSATSKFFGCEPKNYLMRLA